MKTRIAIVVVAGIVSTVAMSRVARGDLVTRARALVDRVRTPVRPATVEQAGREVTVRWQRPAKGFVEVTTIHNDGSGTARVVDRVLVFAKSTPSIDELRGLPKLSATLTVAGQSDPGKLQVIQEYHPPTFEDGGGLFSKARVRTRVQTFFLLTPGLYRGPKRVGVPAAADAK